ncbi:MAG: hypothetical protein ACREJQ_04450 [bacterium]
MGDEQAKEFQERSMPHNTPGGTRLAVMPQKEERVALFQQLGAPASIMGFNFYATLDQVLMGAFRTLGEEKFRAVFEKLIASLRADSGRNE